MPPGGVIVPQNHLAQTAQISVPVHYLFIYLLTLMVKLAFIYNLCRRDKNLLENENTRNKKVS